MIEWLEEMYLSNCDGDWEHDYGIEITTLDNPGWNVKIQLNENFVMLSDRSWVLEDIAPSTWYGYKIEKNTIEASGDPQSLKTIFEIIKGVIIEARNRN